MVAPAIQYQRLHADECVAWGLGAPRARLPSDTASPTNHFHSAPLHSPGNPFVVSLKAIATALPWAVSLVARANTPRAAVAVAATPSIDFTPA